MVVRRSYRLAVKSKHFLARLGRSCEGIAAVEFGLIAPLLLLMLVATIEASRAVSIDRRLGLATTIVADLVAQQEDVVDDTGTNLIPTYYAIAAHVMEPYDTTKLKMAVLPVRAYTDDATIIKVYAPVTDRPAYNGMSQAAICADYSLDAGLLTAAGDGVVVVESSFDYSPIFAQGVIGTDNWFGQRTWTDRAIFRPRQRPAVAFNGELDNDPTCHNPT
jgi:Flp pilus assembly protein TadG